MCQYCGKAGHLYMCLDCQAYDRMRYGPHAYNEAKELDSLNLIRKLLSGKHFTSFIQLYKYVNTVHMRKEIEKYGGDSYCLELRRDPWFIKTLCKI